MIWIIGGTSETGDFIEKIEGKIDYIVTVATYAGMEVLKGKNVMVKRLVYEEMLELIKDNRIEKIVDLTHPYAVEVSKNAQQAASETDVEYIRYVRAKAESEIYHDIIRVDGIDQCAEYLENIEGTVFFTTGSKNIPDFEKIKGKNRFIYRVLPSVFSIEECRSSDIALKDIVALLGPFSVELNMAIFKNYEVDLVVMKDSGTRGRTEEKLIACKKMNIKALMIGREEEQGIYDIDELVELIL